MRAAARIGARDMGVAKRSAGFRDLLPAAAALCYPFLLDGFHRLIGPAGSAPSPAGAVAAALLLAAAFAVPAVGLLWFWRDTAGPALRRLALAVVAAPTLFVFLGVVNFMAGGFYPDELLWCLFWAGLTASAWAARDAPPATAAPRVGGVRVAHGLVAALLLLYILFHIFNHLALLEGPGAHDALRRLGERVYRAPPVEPLLILLFLLQSASGGWLAWRWSAAPAPDFFRAFQLASGVYLLAYIVGHMDSVFLYARLFQNILTDWRFATGAPAGMLHDGWNIRLLPHYALGVFFALTHPLTGLRAILLAHGLRRNVADTGWAIGAAASALLAVLITLGMVAVAPGN